MLAVGKLKAGPEKLLADEYLARAEGLGRKAGISKITVADIGESLGAAEESRFFAGAKGFTIVLDERGKSLTSPAFAEVLRKHLDGATPEVSFLIGGPDGHAATMREKAGLVLSMGAMTWPHRLARVLLFEQIYRAVTILVNHPYHRA